MTSSRLTKGDRVVCKDVNGKQNYGVFVEHSEKTPTVCRVRVDAYGTVFAYWIADVSYDTDWYLALDKDYDLLPIT